MKSDAAQVSKRPEEKGRLRPMNAIEYGKDQKSAAAKAAEYGLIAFAGMVVTWHTWLALTRHLWARENNMLLSPTFMKLLNADFWLTIAFLACALLWFAFGHLLGPGVEDRKKAVLKCLRAPECLMILGLFVWYLVTNLAYSDDSNQLVNYMRYELDAGICAVILFPLGRILGFRRMKRFLDVVLHIILASGTVTICIMLFNFFIGNTLTLPNGLTVHAKPTGRIYFGVNENIEAMISLTMSCICLYMFFIHKRRAGRIVYGAVMLPHVMAMLMTGSRACFLALLFTLPAAAALFVWTQADRPDAKRRLVYSLAAFAIGCACILALRSGLSQLCRIITHSKRGLDERDLLQDNGRLKVWNASLYMMMNFSPKQFVFGILKLEIPKHLTPYLSSLYGESKSYAHAHNQILQVGCAQGIPAMIVYAVFLFATGVRGLRILFMEIKRRYKDGLLVIPICLFGMMVVNMVEPFIWLYFSVMGCVFHLMAGMLPDAEKEISRR